MKNNVAVQREEKAKKGPDHRPGYGKKGGCRKVPKRAFNSKKGELRTAIASRNRTFTTAAEKKCEKRKR